MVNQLFSRFINNPIYFRYGFYCLLIISVLLNSLQLKENNNFYILYIFTVIFLGIGFNNRTKWFLFLLTIIVVTFRYYLIPETEANFVNYLIHLLTYFLITLISAKLMNLVHKVKEDNLELTIALANALDSRDTYTLHHSENVATYSEKIAKKMNLSKHCCEIIRKGALLHDIGKIGIPEQILMKNGKLTDKEYEIIKSHPTIGYEMIKHVGDFEKSGVLDIVLYHHERYDGKGYPKGLAEKQIPLFARIVAVADSFDAMISKRVYRDELDLKYTLNEIRKGKGNQFDPTIVEVFLSLFEDQSINHYDRETLKKRFKLFNNHPYHQR
nr:HD-GYP domain-containing protein [Fredinandcohnia onubensis]